MVIPQVTKKPGKTSKRHKFTREKEKNPAISVKGRGKKMGESNTESKPRRRTDGTEISLRAEPRKPQARCEREEGKGGRATGKKEEK